MKSFYYKDTPMYVHDCAHCQFLRCVCDEQGNAIDIYKKCGPDRGTPYLIRFSSDGPDYTTVSIESLATSYAIAHTNEWKHNLEL